MNNKNDDKEGRLPETLNEALMFLAYHTGMFALKIAVIIAVWVMLVDFLRSLIMP